MPVLNFLVYFGIATLGALSSFAYSVVKAIKTNAYTPNKFEWKYFWSGAVRTILAMIALAIAIVEWDKVSGLIFDSETAIDLTLWSAFLLGTLADRLMDMLLGSSKGAFKKVTIVLLIILAGCVTQRRCIEKFPQDTVYHNSIVYRDTTVQVFIPGDTIRERVKDTIVSVDTKYAHAEAGLTDSEIWLNLIQKTITIPVKFDSVIVTRIDTISIPVPVIKEVHTKTNWQIFLGIGFWVILALFVGTIVLLVFRK
jgi:hypothetical protein